MGSGCLHAFINSNKEVDIEESIKKDNLSVTRLNKNNTNNLDITDGKENKKSKVSQIIDYFNEEEAEILKEYNMLKEKTKIKSKKNTEDKYGLMLQRLLEQKNIKMIGPKRRETIRKEGEKIQTLVEQLLKENKNDILKQSRVESGGTLIIKQPPQKKGRASVTMDKNPLLVNSRKRGENFFMKRNSLSSFLNKGVVKHDYKKNVTMDSIADV